MSRLSVLVFITIFFVNSIFAESLAFLSNRPENPEHTAIIYGANEMLKDLSLRYKKDFSIKDITPQKEQIEVDDQISALEKAFQDGAIGAILIPTDSTSDKLKKAIQDLSAKKFFVCLLKKDIPESSRLLFISSDENKIKKQLERAFKISHSKAFIEVLTVFHSSKEEFLTNKDDLEHLEKSANDDILKFVKTVGDYKPISSKFFSLFRQKYREEIKRLDSHVIVFVDARPLMDMELLPEDSDRAVVISLDILPHIQYYMANRQIDLAIGDDYIGFGQIATQRLIEAYLESKLPTKDSIKLSPIFYTPEDTVKFEKDWLTLMQ